MDGSSRSYFYSRKFLADNRRYVKLGLLYCQIMRTALIPNHL